MKPILFFFLFLTIQLPVSAGNKIDQALYELDELINSRETFVQRKQKNIELLRQQFSLTNETPPDAYNYCLALSREYQSFKFDSAFFYTNQLMHIAAKTGDAEKIAWAKMEFANILISSGLINEAIDTLNQLNLHDLNPEIQGNYYMVMSRAYFDLESFSQSPFYSNLYRKKGMMAFDSSLIYLSENTWKYHSVLAQKALKEGRNEYAKQILDSLIEQNELNDEDLGALQMTLAFTYSILGDKDEALFRMIQASISDFKSAKKEAVALLFTANYLFEQGDVIRASKYINVALDDSHFYGSSFRLWQISQYLPVIKSQHIITIEDQKKKLLYFLIVVSILSVTVISAIVIIFKQFSVVRKAKVEVDQTNLLLAKINEELAVTNRIKEEYIGYFFSVNSVLLEKLDQFKSSINRKFKRKQYDEIAIELNNLSIPREKEIILENFDKVFLQIYPDFVSKFNKLMKKGEEIHLKEGQLLNTELRIFALVRLGIHNPEKIAKILDYSLNTIYAYKNRIKTRSLISNDEFENEIMKIKHF
ncbi:MAG: DUF6377 domain-containing protein [Prolixibacteraceae bacterium]